MSLETLLEAAQWVESSSKEKTREDSSRHFHHYAKSPSISEDNSDGRGTEDSREKRRTGGAGTREVHNKLEKNRRAHLKECFDTLKKQIPYMEDKKTSNLSILRGSLKYIQNLRRKERENELELQRLAQEKSQLRDRFERLQDELDQLNVKVDLNHFLQTTQDQDSNSTSTATEGPGSLSTSDDEVEEEVVTPQQPLARAIPHSVIRTVTSATSSPGMHTSPPQGQALSHMTPLNLIMTTTVNTTAVQPAPVVVRPPVTQLLQQTLEKRQAQNKLQQSGGNQVLTVPSNPASRQLVKTLPVSMPNTYTSGAVTFSPVMSIMSNTGQGSSKMASMPATQAKPFSQSILLTNSTTNHTQPSATLLPASIGLGCTPVITPIRATTTASMAPVSSGLTSSSQLARPILRAAVQGNSGATQVLTASPLTLSQHHLLTQLPRGAGLGMGGLPLVSLSAAGAQLMSPLTVMAPGMGVIGTPLIKQFPLLQQHQLLPGTPVLQHAHSQQPQQSIINPLVVVSVPSSGTTSASPVVSVSQS